MLFWSHRDCSSEVLATELGSLLPQNRVEDWSSALTMSGSRRTHHLQGHLALIGGDVLRQQTVAVVSLVRLIGLNAIDLFVTVA